MSSLEDADQCRGARRQERRGGGEGDARLARLSWGAQHGGKAVVRSGCHACLGRLSSY